MEYNSDLFRFILENQLNRKSETLFIPNQFCDYCGKEFTNDCEIYNVGKYNRGYYVEYFHEFCYDKILLKT